MKKFDSKEFFKNHTDVLVLILIGIFCTISSIFGIFDNMEFRLYDAMLRNGKKVEKSDKILLVDINDASIDHVGVWPWSRDIIADLLVRMKEFGAYNIIFDIEYLQRSSNTIVPNANSIMQESVDAAKGSISSIVSQFSDAAASGAYSPEELYQISDMMVNDYVSPTLDSIMNKSLELSRDNDEYFAKTLQFFGNSWLTVNAGMGHELDIAESSYSEAEVTDDQRQFMAARDYAIARTLFRNLKDNFGLVERDNEQSCKEQNSYRGFYPARNMFIRAAVGAGATNVIVDKDGTRRRIELAHHLDPNKKFLWNHSNGKYTPKEMAGNYYILQLAAAPLVRYLQVDAIERTLTSFILKNAILPGSNKPTDIRIPVDSKGRMLVNWLHEGYEDSFKKHVSAAFVYELDRCEERIFQHISNLTRIRMTDDEGYDLPYFVYATELIDQYRFIEKMKNELLEKCKGFSENGVAVDGGISDEEYETFFALRKDYYSKINEYANANFKETTVPLLLSLDNGENTQSIQQAAQEMEASFEGILIDSQHFSDYYNQLAESFRDSFCFIGVTATASTDIGVTPFESKYPNLGTHANVTNTILQQDFIIPIPEFLGIAFAFFVALAVIVKTRTKSNDIKNLSAIIYVAGPIAILYFLMVNWKIYTPIFIPAMLVVLTFILEMIVNFIATENDRKTLRRGFDAYVSPEVVNQIVKDPSHLSLGGANKHITALFSDVKSFSGFTEMINNEEGETNGAVRLVSILNEYLGQLSDAIMDNKGTIDKYVGDEIVSFFGAPIDDDYNAFNACVAGIRMKQVETEYNKKHYETDHDIPMPLLSRVGLNTGYMVVGNMGTEKKLNYTIMGNNVNLASRLEGTNKAYGSWIMCSESTWNAANTDKKEGLLLARTFDCVQVINVKKPVQLYNILGLKSECPREQIEAAAIFNEGMKYYLNGRDTPKEKKNIDEIKKALALFRQAEKCYGEDKSSKVFIDRCEELIANGLPEIWDGVYVMKSK